MTHVDKARAWNAIAEKNAEIGRLKAYWWAWRQLSIDLRKDIANDAEGEWRDVLTADCDPHR